MSYFRLFLNMYKIKNNNTEMQKEVNKKNTKEELALLDKSDII